MAYSDSTILPQSFRFNAVETVDTVFSKILVSNLFKDNTFKAGVTFTDKYNERGGQIYARRVGKSTVAEQNALQSGGLDLGEGTETADSLILIQKADELHVNEKCYDMVENLRASGKSVDKVADVVASFKEKMQMKMMGYLLKDPVTSGGVLLGGAIRSVTTTASETLADLIANILRDREQIRVNGGEADVLIISPQMESLFLANAYTSGNAFIPETNESLIRDGKIGRLYGMNVFSSNLLGGGTPTALPVAGNAVSNVGLTASACEYVIYDHDTFAVAMDILGLRLENAHTFFGSYAQIQGVMGGGVVNPALAIAKIVSSDDFANVTGLSITGGNFSMKATDDPVTLEVIAVRQDGSTFVVKDLSDLTWTSGTVATATVSNGVITAVAQGTTLITVVIPDTEVEAQITVTVTAAS